MPLTAEHGRLAIATARSHNEKIGDCATTYAAQVSCPTSCVFFNGGGCYAENGRIASGVTNPLNGAARLAQATAIDVAHAEAAAIDALDVVAGQPLRLHTVGDCKTDEAARIVAAAADRYMQRGGGPVWTYTHAWRTVDRASWGSVSVLASCETAEQAELARARGYAPSIVVEHFEERRRHRTCPDNARSSLDVLPCPAQTTEGVSCSSCRLCMDDVALRGRGYAIAFAIHGTNYVIKKAQQSLRTPGDDTRRLTSRDHAVAFLDEHGRLPYVRELRELADVTWATANEMLERLEHELAAVA